MGRDENKKEQRFIYKLLFYEISCYDENMDLFWNFTVRIYNLSGKSFHIYID